jgi:hypothetical protein
MSKYAYIALAVCLLVGSSYWYGRSDGYDLRVAKENNGQAQQLKTDAKRVDGLRADERKTEVVYRERIKIVRETVDDCLPRRMPDPVLEQLRAAGAGRAP